MAELSPASAYWSDRLNEIQQWLKPVAGTWVEALLATGITGLQAVLAFSILVGALIVGWLIRRVSRRAARPASDPGKTVSESLLHLTLRDALDPILLLVLVLAAYVSGCLLFFRVPRYSQEILAILTWAQRAGVVAASFWFLFRLIGVAEILLNRWANRTVRKWDNVLVSVLVRALRLLVPLLGILLIMPTLGLPTSWHDTLQAGALLVVMGFLGLMVCELLNTAETAVMTQYRVDVQDNLAMRKVQTQVRIMKRIGVVITVTVTVACMLTVFAPVRALGHSILASAGVAGIVLGIAAQRSLGLFLAGIQIALTQPIRLDDVVIAEGEWGRVEEITLTYVVLALWDKRRLILPITYFVEKPFQNWTRSASALLGTVFLYLDYTVPIKELREELARILKNSKNWDGAVQALQVTDLKERNVEVRILASAADSSVAFDLRCELREQLLDFIRTRYPNALPVSRIELRSHGSVDQAKLAGNGSPSADRATEAGAKITA